MLWLPSQRVAADYQAPWYPHEKPRNGAVSHGLHEWTQEDGRGPELLRLVGGQCGRELVGALDVMQIQAVPALEVGAQRQVHVLHHCVTLPATRIADGLNAPDAGSATEVEEPASVGACPLLHLVVEVEVDALGWGMGKARLDSAVGVLERVVVGGKEGTFLQKQQLRPQRAVQVRLEMAMLQLAHECQGRTKCAADDHIC
jgi:hypothetical protein